VVITDGEAEIRYVLPTSPDGPHRPFCQLRKDHLDGAVSAEVACRIWLRWRGAAMATRSAPEQAAVRALCQAAGQTLADWLQAQNPLPGPGEGRCHITDGREHLLAKALS
jgi:hypothetical protein